MDVEILIILLVGWLMCISYIYSTFEDFKNWREQDAYMKLVMFHVGIVFILCNFLLVLFFLNAAGIIGQLS